MRLKSIVGAIGDEMELSLLATKSDDGLWWVLAPGLSARADRGEQQPGSDQ